MVNLKIRMKWIWWHCNIPILFICQCNQSKNILTLDLLTWTDWHRQGLWLNWEEESTWPVRQTETPRGCQGAAGRRASLIHPISLQYQVCELQTATQSWGGIKGQMKTNCDLPPLCYLWAETGRCLVPLRCRTLHRCWQCRWSAVSGLWYDGTEHCDPGNETGDWSRLQACKHVHTVQYYMRENVLSLVCIEVMNPSLLINI